MKNTDFVEERLVDYKKIKEKIYVDANKRSQDIYRMYKYLCKNQDSKLIFNIIDENSIGGKSWENKDIDNIEIKKGVYERAFDYFFQMSQEKNLNYYKLLLKI